MSMKDTATENTVVRSIKRGGFTERHMRALNSMVRGGQATVEIHIAGVPGIGAEYLEAILAQADAQHAADVEKAKAKKDK